MIRAVMRSVGRAVGSTGMTLGMLATLFLSASLSAQVRPDSVQKDTVRVAVPASLPASDTVPKRNVAADSVVFAREVARADSMRRAIEADTIKPPIARFEQPADFETTTRLRFSREDILRSGAINLVDVLDRIPGMTTYRSGWIAGINAAAFVGDIKRLRLFLDGVELDAIEPRNGGALDLTDVQLWTLDELVVERAAGEVRIWMRTWTVERTTPYTRADIFTGDLNTNAFRGVFSRRWRNGMLLQLGGSQTATQSGRVNAFTGAESSGGRGDGTVQAFMTRIGWSNRRLSVDLFANASSRERDPHSAREGFNDLLAYKGSRRDGYIRVGYGDTLRGFWSQAIIGVVRTRLKGVASTTGLEMSDTAAMASSDTIRGRTQQVLATGYRSRLWSLSLSNRARPIDGAMVNAPSLRARVGGARLGVGAFIERNGIDSTRRVDVFVRSQPLSWFVLTGAHSAHTPDTLTGRVSRGTWRTEAAVRVKRLWIGAGILRDGATSFPSPVIIGVRDAVLSANAAKGMLVSASGRVYKDLHLDVQAIRWDASAFGRPQTHVRTELALISDWRRRFPRGEFSINARLWHELRGAVPFLLAGAADDSEPEIGLTEQAQVVTGMLELRIQRATLFYQYRNLTGGAYEQIRGITMPPAVQMYGVRWEFWN